MVDVTPFMCSAEQNDLIAVNELYKAGANPFAKIVGGFSRKRRGLTTHETVSQHDKRNPGEYKAILARIKELEALWIAKQKAKEVRGRPGNNWQKWENLSRYLTY